MSAVQRVAVIGAGLAGTACARALSEHGLDVTLVEKSRGAGGRTSTRRDGIWRFDHGAARLELGAPELAERRATWEAAGVIAAWSPRGAADHTETWIGVPGANALCTHLARGLPLCSGQRVTTLDQTDRGWRLVLENGEALGLFDAVAITAPAPQARALLAASQISDHDTTLATAELAPCLAAMVVIAPREVHDLDELRPGPGAIAHAHRMDRRSGRATAAGNQAWVLHGDEAWSRAHLEEEPDQAAHVLAADLTHAIPGKVLEVRGHRWRFARAIRRIAAPYLLDRERRIGVAGDWFEPGTRAPAASRALLSGFALADALRSA